MILPIHAVLEQLKTALSQTHQVVLQAPPGAGKTTIVPLALLEEPWLCHKKIILLEPRRLAARNAALRMAQLLDEPIGKRVGYRMRQERKVSVHTRIEVVTEGVLTRMLQSDPALEETGVLMFDEFHERSLHADLGLALALQSQALLRPDLRLLVMSATLDTAPLMRVMPGAQVLGSEGRCYPVEHRYLDARTPAPDTKTVVALTVDTIRAALKTEEGGILAFLPGVREIKAVATGLKASLPLGCHVAALYGDLDKSAQQRAIAPSAMGERKIVLATNIAETSLTIEGVRIVIDSGLARFVHYDTVAGMNRMQTCMIGADSATQRSGRAGRTQSGVCYRLWHAQKPLMAHAKPEILQSDLATLMLELAQWGSDVDEHRWADRPPPHAVDAAKRLLDTLAMTQNGRITLHGQKALALGTHPRIAHMLLEASQHAKGYEGVLLATLLQERTGFDDIDLSVGMEELDRALSKGGVPATVRRGVEALLKRLGCRRIQAPDLKITGALTALVYPERIARRRSRGSAHFLMASGKGALLRDESAWVHAPYLAVADAGGHGEQLIIFHAAVLTQVQIETWFASSIETRNTVGWNDASGRVEAFTVRQIGAVELTREPMASVDPDRMAFGMIEGVQQRGLEALPWNARSRSLRCRAAFVNRHEEGTFALLDDTTLQKTMNAWLLPYLSGIRDVKGLQALDMAAIISGMLGYASLAKLDRLAPETLVVPSGSHIRIDYSDPMQPVLAVRLQELFGLHTTPSVLEGRVPLVLHLLSPAQRPVQITQDLVSFWNSGYAEVRKTLRGKYKKHYWPEDPYEAVATSKTKKGMGL